MESKGEIIKDFAKFRKAHGLYTPEINALLSALISEWSIMSIVLFAFGALFGYNLGVHK